MFSEKSYFNKIKEILKAKKPSAKDIQSDMEMLDGDRETAKEYAIFVIKECEKDERLKGYQFEAFPDYIKLDEEMYEKCFGDSFTLNPYQEMFKGEKHQFIMPSRGDECLSIALIDGKFYSGVAMNSISKDMAKITLNPSAFLTADIWRTYREVALDNIFGSEVEILKNIAYRSLEVELESLENEADKEKYRIYAEELKKAIEWKIEQEKKNLLAREDDPIENE